MTKVVNVGFSAQDVQKIFPEAVGTDTNGYLNFNMHSVLVASVNAIQEQQAIIDNQNKKIDNMRKLNEQLIKRIEALEKK